MSTSGGGQAGGGGGGEAAAYGHFVRGHYDKAVDALQKMPQRLRGDLRLQHNLAVAAFYRNACADATRLADALDALVTTAAAASSTSEASSSSKMDEAGRSGGVGAVLSLATLRYNQAVLCYRLRRYTKALDVLENHLYAHLEALDEDLALRVCLLLVDVLLMVGQSGKAHAVLVCVEKMFGSFTSGAVAGRASSLGEADANGSRDDAPASKISASPGRPLSLTTEQVQLMMHLYRAKLYLLSKSANATKKELNQASEIFAQMSADMQQKSSTLASGGVAAQLAFLKAHLEYLRRNHRKAAKLLSVFHRRASSSTSSNNDMQQTPGMPSTDGLPGMQLYLNNMGCIYYQLAKYGAAAYQLAKAIRDDRSSSSEPSASSTSRRCEMYANQGMQLLLTGKPALASRCFIRAAEAHHHHPRLWLRLAQCAIATHIANERDASVRQQKSSTIARILTHEPKRCQIVLPLQPPHSSSFSLYGGALTNSSLLKSTSTISSALPVLPLPNLSHTLTSPSGEDPGQNDATSVQATLSLRYALECLRNAINLLSKPDTESNTAVSTAVDTNGISTGNVPSSSDSAAALANSSKALECLCLITMAYVALALDDPVIALSAAAAALSLNNAPPTVGSNGTSSMVMSDENRLLAHLYAAEALCRLNRPMEAMQHLAPSLIKDIPLSAPSSASVSSTAQPGAYGPPPPSAPFGLPPALAMSARYALYINLAATHILQDKFPQAQKCLLHATAINAASPHALLLQTYIELARGNTGAALALLRRGKLMPFSVSSTPNAAYSSAGAGAQDGRSSASSSSK